MDSIYIVGVGITRFGKFLDTSLKQLTREAVEAALRDAGATQSMIGAAFFANATQGAIEGQHMVKGQIALREMGFEETPIVNVENACASASTALQLACTHLLSGASDCVLAIGAEKMYHADKARGFAVFDGAWDVATAQQTADTLSALGAGVLPPPGRETPDAQRSLFMDVYANLAKYHMKTYGTTERHLAAVAAKNHHHSTMNPLSQYQTDATIDEVLAARMVAWPLTLPMCAPISDGAAAAIVCNEEGLRRHGFDRRRAVSVKACVLAGGTNRQPTDLPRQIGRLAALRAYDQAGVGPQDIDVAEVHDASAFAEIQQSENLGFAEYGQGGWIAEHGETRLGGANPDQSVRGARIQGPPDRRHRPRASARARHPTAQRGWTPPGRRRPPGHRRERWRFLSLRGSAGRRHHPGRARGVKTEQPLNIAAFLPVVAAVHGQRPAVSVGRDLFCDYAGLRRRVAALAGSLVGPLGLARGARVAVAMRNSPQYFEVLLACWHAGLIAVPMNAKLHPRELAYILGHTEAALCFVSEDLRPGVLPLRSEIAALQRVLCVDGAEYEPLTRGEEVPIADTREHDPAWLFYTSGTTGRPKGATLSHRNLMAMALRYYADISTVDETHCYFHAAPLSHGGGLYGLPHLMKGSHQVIPKSRGFDVDELFDLLEVYDKATFFAAPTMLTRMTNHPRSATARVGAIDTLYYGGAPMYVEDLKRAIRRFGRCLYQIFGQGESPMTGVGLAKSLHVDYGHPKYEQRLGSTGVARTGVEVRVVDADDRDVPSGTLGEVLFRSDVTMLGYWNDPEATAGALRGGWLHTGDVGLMDEDGFVTLRDRSKDMIISGGSNIYPREIEEVLMADPRVRECTVIGRPHADWGEEVVAFVVPHQGQGLAAAELDALCLSNIARFKRPKAYFFVDDLPKSNYGKVLKRTLREQLAAGCFAEQGVEAT